VCYYTVCYYTEPFLVLFSILFNFAHICWCSQHVPSLHSLPPPGLFSSVAPFFIFFDFTLLPDCRWPHPQLTDGPPASQPEKLPSASCLLDKVPERHTCRASQHWLQRKGSKRQKKKRKKGNKEKSKKRSPLLLLLLLLLPQSERPGPFLLVLPLQTTQSH
jgi:hypothetical protein